MCVCVCFLNKISKVWCNLDAMFTFLLSRNPWLVVPLVSVSWVFVLASWRPHWPATHRKRRLPGTRSSWGHWRHAADGHREFVGYDHGVYITRGLSSTGIPILRSGGHMVTFRNTGPLWRESTGCLCVSPTKGQWQWTLLFWAWRSYWNNRVTGNLRRHDVHATSIHDDVIKWKHFPRCWPFVRRIHRSLVNSSHKGQWRGALMFSLICVWINDWVNNGEAGDLRRYSIHYGVTVMHFNTLFIMGIPIPVMQHIYIEMVPVLFLKYSHIYLYHYRWKKLVE